MKKLSLKFHEKRAGRHEYDSFSPNTNVEHAAFVRGYRHHDLKGASTEAEAVAWSRGVKVARLDIERAARARRSVP